MSKQKLFDFCKSCAFCSADKTKCTAGNSDIDVRPIGCILWNNHKSMNPITEDIIDKVCSDNEFLKGLEK